MPRISDEMYEQLRRILEKENVQSFTLEETKVIGDGLIDILLLLVEPEKQALRAIWTLVGVKKITLKT